LLIIVDCLLTEDANGNRGSWAVSLRNFSQSGFENNLSSTILKWKFISFLP
jgi:hypothetical protein